MKIQIGGRGRYGNKLSTVENLTRGKLGWMTKVNLRNHKVVTHAKSGFRWVTRQSKGERVLMAQGL